jgi:hypothetical protein
MMTLPSCHSMICGFSVAVVFFFSGYGVHTTSTVLETQGEASPGHSRPEKETRLYMLLA